MKIRHDRVRGGLFRPQLFLDFSCVKFELLNGELDGERIVIVDEESGESGELFMDDIDDADEDEQDDDDDSLIS